MSRIAEATEKEIDYRHRMQTRAPELAEARDITTAISHATCTVAEDIQAKAIITVTISGFTAFRLSQYKPECPIIACTTQSIVACQMNLMFGVVPLIIPHEDTAEMLFDTAVRQALRLGKVVYHPDMCVTHVWSRDSQHDRMQTLQHIRSTLQFFRKWGWKW